MQILQESECPAADFSDGDNKINYKSAIYWRSILKKYKYARKEIEEQKKIKEEVISHYSEDIEKRVQHLNSIENYIKSNIHLFARKTKSGSLSIDHFPDIGTISLAKPKMNLKPDPDYWSKNGFNKTIIKFDVNQFKERYNLIDGKIVDKNTGELVDLPNVKIEKKQVLSFRRGGE